MVTAITERTTRQRYSLSAFLELATELELAGSQEWFELMGGELVAHASPDDPHMLAAMAVLRYLSDARVAGYGREGCDRVVALDYRGPDQPVAYAVKPDAFFVTRERLAILHVPDIPAVGGAPDIVVEVLSPSTARHDRPPRGRKFRAYDQTGVRFYWLVDPRLRMLTTYERRDARLVEVAVLGPNDTLRCPLFP